MDGRPVPEGASDQDVRPGNPFLKLRTRTLIPWVIIGMIILFVPLAIADSMIQADLLDSATGDMVGEIAVYAVLAAWIAYACRNSEADLGRLIGRLPPGYNWLPAAGLLAISMAFSIGSVYLTAYGLHRLAPGVMEWLLTLDMAVPDSIAFHVLSAIIAVVIAPVLEELLFRGFLVGRWAVKWGLRTGIVATAVVFGLLHVPDVAGATAFGLITALLYLQTRTLIVPVVFHAANNLIATLGGFAVASEEPWTLAAELEEIEAMLIPGLIITVVTLPVLLWYIRRNWPARDARLPYMDA